jgi:hypothetical protein
LVWSKAPLPRVYIERSSYRDPLAQWLNLSTMNHKTSIRETVLKFNRGETLSPEENAELEAWRERVLLDEKELDLFSEEEWPEEKIGELPGMPEEVWDDIDGRVMAEKRATIGSRYSKWLFPALSTAAVLIIIIAAGLYGYRYQHSLRTPGVSAVVSWETIASGHYHGELSGAGGLQFIDSSTDGQAEPFPRRLPDGSVATLSYRSSLRYGAHFKDSARELWLQGDACFDVVKDPRHPLLVHIGTTTVEVLGTRFNCMNYPGMTGEITVLSGSVRVKDGTRSRDLKSAQRALIGQEQGQEGLTTTITVEEADHPNNSIAWMDPNPTIESDDQELYTLVCKLAYYYHFDVGWPPTLKAGKVTASLFLRNSLRQNVEIINAGLKDINLDIKDRVIDVTPKRHFY